MIRRSKLPIKTGAAGVLAAVAILLLAPSWNVLAQQGEERSTSELTRDLKDTRSELKSIRSLQSKLESAGRQSSNSGRQKVINELQEQMGACIIRRERDLGDKYTIVQHGTDVKDGTTDAAKVGTPVATKTGNRNLDAFTGPDGDRMKQLSNMKSIYVGTKNSSLMAIEKQTDAFERYTEAVEKFAGQLEWAEANLSAELDRREKEKEEAEKALEEEENQ